MGAIERIDSKLHPFMIFNHILFQQSIVDMMPRVSFMSSQVNSTVYIYRKTCIYLDKAIAISLVPIICPPGFVFNIFNRKMLLVGREICCRVRFRHSLIAAVNTAFSLSTGITKDLRNSDNLFFSNITFSGERIIRKF